MSDMSYEDMDQVGPHVKCAAQIETGYVRVYRAEWIEDFTPCRLPPGDGHTTHRSAGDCRVWERVERRLR